jgi:tetratricopeptide (TPR) repeat protein
VEKDLEKQIEVAPFKVWSYEKLAERRQAQGRLGEACDLYARAAAIEPRKAERWVDLGHAQARAGRAEEARRSLEQATPLEPADWLKLRSAQAYRTLGDMARAGELAESAAASLARRIGDLVPSQVDEDDLYWAERLAEAWHIVGLSAATGGDEAKAERYLDAAWRLSFSPESAWALGDLREKQGKLAQAVQMWSMAAAVPSASHRLPADRQARIEAAIRGLPNPPATTPRPSWPGAKPARQEAAEAQLMELRTIRVPGPVAVDLTEDVLVLADGDGRIERIVNVSRRSEAAFDRQVPKLGASRLASPRPGLEPLKTLRRALFACSTLSGCALVLDLPGMGTVQTGKSVASLRIVSLEPEEGTALSPGQSVTVAMRLHYEIGWKRGFVSLGAVDQAGTPLVEPSAMETVTAPSGDIDLKVTFMVPSGASRVDVLVAVGGGSGPDDIALIPKSYPVKPR